MTPIVSLEADFDKDAEELWFRRDSEGTDQGGETRLRKEDWDIALTGVLGVPPCLCPLHFPLPPAFSKLLSQNIPDPCTLLVLL